jgi:membrane protein implicated in regulation of membrane protease activity
MGSALIWVLVAIVLAIGEMLTLGFFLAPFAGGALVAALADGLGASSGVALVIFIVVSLVLLLFVRPVARAHRRLPPQLRTGTAALVGQPAIVVEQIVNREAIGAVRIGGEVWTARSYDDDLVMDVGADVHVIEIRGATAIVAD